MSLKNRSLKTLKYTLIGVSSLLLSTIVIVSLLLFTNTGNQALIKIAKSFESRLSVELVEGSLFLSPVYENISWLDGETQIKIDTIDYEFNWSCLFDGLCLTSLNIDGANISIPEPIAQVEPKREEDPATTDINIPIELILKNINLSRLKFTMGELIVDLEKFTLQVDAFHKDIDLVSQISGLLITLPNTVVPIQANKKSNSSSAKIPLKLDIKSLPALLTADMLPTVVLPVNLNIKPINISEVKVVQNNKTLFALNELQTKFTFKQSELLISQFDLNIPETTLHLHGGINFVENYPLNISIDGQLKTVKQLQPETLLNKLRYRLETKGSLSDLSSELQLSELIDLQLQTHLDLFADNLPHTIDLKWRDINWPLSGESLYSSKQGRFISSGSLLDHTIQFDTEYALTGLPSGKVKLNTKGDLKHLDVKNLTVETLDGIVDFSGLLTWSNSIDWLGKLSLQDIDLQKLDSAYDGQLSGIIKQKVSVSLYENSPPEWMFDFPELAIDGALLSRPLSVSGRVSGDDKDGIKFEKLSVNNADNQFIVDGLFAEQNNLNIKLDVQDLSHAVLATKGKISGKINLQGPLSALEITTDLDATDLSYQTYLLEKLKLKSSVVLTEKPQLALSLTAKQITVDKQVIEKVSLQVDNKPVEENLFEHHVELQLNSELISTDLSLQLTQTDSELFTQLNKAKLLLPYQTLTLDKPFQVTSQKERIQLTNHCWFATASNGKNSTQAGKLCINKFDVGENGAVELDLDNYLLQNINPFMPEQFKMQGALSADADVSWNKGDNPEFVVNVNSDDMLLKIKSDSKSDISTDFPMETFNINLKGEKTEIDIDAKVFAENLIDVDVKGQLLPYGDKATVDSSVLINLPNFELFLPLIPQLESVKGQLVSQLSITGNLEKPTVNGELYISNTEVGAVALPMKISELNSSITINDTQATISGSFNTRDNNTIVEKAADVPLLTDTLSILDMSVKFIGEKISSDDGNNKIGTEAIPGMAYINGQVDWSDKINGDIHFSAHKLEVYEYGKIDLLVSPDIHLSVNDEIILNGEIYIDKGKIVVKELPEGAVSQSKDIVVIDVKKEKAVADLPLIIDLSVDMGPKFQLVALGLDSFIDGRLLIKKKVEKDLSINGELQFVDGSYRSLGQELLLRKSRVVFHGAPDTPYLTIEAIRDPDKVEDNVIAGVRVIGTPDEMELAIFSEPAMAQQEALSYLTRGQSLNSSSDSSTMANMLIDIAAGQSGGLMSSIGEEVGIKDLSLSSSGSGDEQSVGLRGEIAPGVEMSYGVGVFDSFSIFALRYELFERFYIEASTSVSQAVDAYYEWNWD